MIHISIPKPCHEDWNEMIPNQQGRHCNVCCKTVVDFTNMNDDEVKYFFINKKKEESVCGRFKTDQLQRINITLPYNIYKLSMPLWKQFLAACLLAFSSMLFSCDALVGKADTLGETLPFVMADDKSAINTPPPFNSTLGGIRLNIDTTVEQTCTTLTGDIISVETITQGMSVIEPVEQEKEFPLMGVPEIQEPDTSQTILTGKIAYDTSSFINPNTIDSAKTKKDSSTCDNQFLNL